MPGVPDPPGVDELPEQVRQRLLQGIGAPHATAHKIWGTVRTGSGSVSVGHTSFGR
jgi:hypothetical protein